MHGGKRTGAGRKQGFAAKNAEEARKLLSERLAQEIDPTSRALINKAKTGDERAIHELFDRAWGRAAQELKIEGKRERIAIPLMGIRLTPEALDEYAFTDEEMEILQKRL